jgi:glycosyltransferase involved in cell wall biosynthesis
VAADLVRVDQVLPVFVSRDAIGVHTLNVQRALHGAGIDSEIFFLRSTPEVASLGHHVSELARSDPSRHVLYHSSIGSSVVNELGSLKGPLLIDYHNITPARFFQRWAPATASEVALGRRQLAELAPRCAGALADSSYNERELIDVGYRNTAVAPLLINIEEHNREVNQQLLELLVARKQASGGPSFLFVGTLSPHKAPHDLVAMLATYRSLYHPKATLTLVGRPFEGRYSSALEGYVKALDLSDAVTITGSLANEDLEAHWRSADVFTCASDHEGFCVPMVEAMSHELPIVAYGVAAIPETLGPAGLVLEDKTPVSFAAAIHRVLGDEALRRQLIAAGSAKLAEYELPVASARFLRALEGVLGALREVARPGST